MALLKLPACQELNYSNRSMHVMALMKERELMSHADPLLEITEDQLVEVTRMSDDQWFSWMTTRRQSFRREIRAA